MAKTRRVIRKLKPPQYQPLDEQLWPVIVALVVLGGFTMGSLLAYLRFDDPRWYANAVTWLVVAAVAYGGAAVVLTLVDNRVFRRSMQLAILLGLLLHAILLVVSIELEVFGPAFQQFLARSDLAEHRQPVTIPEYIQPTRQNRTQEDLERPVETETPASEPEPLERQQPEPETVPPEPQPTPVPEPEQTPKPTLAKQPPTQETAPRFSEQESRLSRRLTPAQTLPANTTVAAVAQTQPAPSPPASVQAREAAVDRRETTAAVARQTPPHEPTTADVQPETNVARRTPQAAPQAESSATPTLERQVARPIQVPRTAVDLGDAPSLARRTSPSEIQPQTTSALHQSTASPDRTRQPAEPVPDVERPEAREPQRAQMQTQPQPEVARAPVSVPNQRTRATNRPEVATAASQVAPAPAAGPASPQAASATAVATAVPRAQGESQTPEQAAAKSPPVEPAVPAPQTPVASPTRPPQAPAAPQVAQAAAPSPARRTPSPLQPAPPAAAEKVAAAAEPADATVASPQPQAASLARSTAPTPVPPALATLAEPAAPAPNAEVQPPPRKSPTTAPAPSLAPSLAAAPPRRPAADVPTPATATGAEVRQTMPETLGGEAAANQSAAIAVTAPRQAASAERVVAASPSAAAAPAQAAGNSPAPPLARRNAESAGSIAAETTTAPAATPRRQTATPQVAGAASADAVAPAGPAAQVPALSALAASTSRQTPVASASGPASSAAAAPAAAGSSAPVSGAPSASRRPSGEQAPELAASPLASTARRLEVATAPNLTTIAADVASPSAPTRGDSDQPRPSLATVARQPNAEPAAVRSQPNLDAPAASTTTQIGRPASRPLQPGDSPSIAPDASPAATVARATTRASVAASPENVESPAVAETSRGVGSPNAEPARMALSKALTGMAGIGQGRNLDRAQPAADSPALITSAAARRAQATQENPPGPALSPQASALVRRAAAGNQTPTASQQAQADAETALVAGAPQPDQLAASASAALTRADAAAPTGPVTGTTGVTEVDLGPSRAVSEGQVGRGSGGGQPTLNFETDSPRIARSDNVGGAPQAALASPAAAEIPTAPPATAGSQPLMPLADLAPTAAARTDAGGLSPSSGGPATGVEVGPPTEVSIARSADQPALTRAELSQAVPDPAAAGGGANDEDEEERKRRLARAAAQALAITTPASAEGVDASTAAAGQAGPALAAVGAAVARDSTDGAATADAAARAASGAPGEASPVAGASPSLGRAEVPPDVPEGPPAIAASGTALARAGQGAEAPSTSLQADPAGVTVGVAASPGTPSAAAATAVARAEVGSTAGTDPAAGLTSAFGPPASATTASMGRAAPGADERPAAESGMAAPQVARAGRPAPGAPSLELAVVLPGAPGGTADSRGAAGQPTAAAATSLARATPGAAAPAGGSPGEVPASLAAESSEMIPAASLGRTATTESAPGANVSGGGQPDVTADAAAGITLARRRGRDTAPAGLAGLMGATAAEPVGSMSAGNLAATPAADSAAGPVATADIRAAANAGSMSAPATSVAGPSASASGGELLAAGQYQRAEAAESVSGEPSLGGGTAAPTRAAVGPGLATDVRVESVTLAGTPQSGGADDGRPLAALGGEARNLPAGRVAPPNPGPVGAMAGQPELDVAVAAAPGVAAGTRLASPGTVDGPALGQATNGGAPLKRSDRTALPAGSVEVAVVDMPGRGSFTPDPTADADHSPGDALGQLDVSRQATEGGLAVNVDAAAGPGGLGEGTAVDVGLNNRRAVRDSMQVAMNASRFVRHQVGGLPATSTAAVVPTESFRRRRARGEDGGWGEGRGSPPPLTEETVDLGLSFLVRQQLADGSWSLQSIPGESASLLTDTGATALALLAFQGAGYSHREHQYADVVRAGIDYLLKSQKPDGDLYVPLDETSNQSVWLYSHALATLVLCEAYGMTQDPSLKEPAQKALNFIVASQHPERGGWRYAPQVGSDTSVSGWMMMALKSGELAGLTVPQETYDRLRQWLDKSQASERDPHLYRYNPLAPNTPAQAHGREATKSMTAVGLLMRLYLGWRRDNPNMVNGAKYLQENLPSLGTPRQPQRDTYYWYYATQVMFHMGGDYWQAWNERLHPLLTEAQIKSGPLAGSWDPRGPIPDRWAPHAGRLYVTTMNILSLEVYYRHLPLYEDTLR